MKMKWTVILCLFAMPASFACTVCNGAPDDPQTKAAKLAVIFMICLTYPIVGWFLVKFLRLIHRNSQ